MNNERMIADKGNNGLTATIKYNYAVIQLSPRKFAIMRNSTSNFHPLCWDLMSKTYTTIGKAYDAMTALNKGEV
jgi:hypothetical protein